MKLDWQENDDDPWLRVGEPDNDLDGKYLFFSRNQLLLVYLIEDEIINHGFKVGKIIAEAEPLQDYVACLYWTGPERRQELAKRWVKHPIIKYRYYKRNADTRAGKYSKQFLEGKI